MSIAAYSYDAGNQRISKTTGGVTTRYVYDRNHVALEVTGAATTPNVRYFYGTRVDQILSQDKGGGNVSWQLTDQLGSVRSLVGNDGVVRNRFEYDAFGSVVSTMVGATDDSRYRYTGREFDAETGLNYYRARYFDSFSGRFIGQDPIGFQAGDANLYRYVGNKVTTYVDPSGKDSAAAVALVEASSKRSPTIAIYYKKFQNYPLALKSATDWFYLISVRGERAQKPFDTNSWLIVSPIENDIGSVVLRPYGLKDRGNLRMAPKIEFQKEKGKNGRYPVGALGATEVIFEYKDKNDDDGTQRCPVLFPKQEPNLEGGRPVYPWVLPDINWPRLPEGIPIPGLGNPSEAY